MKGYRTIIANILVGAVAVMALPEVLDLIPASGLKYVIAGQAVMNIILRVITTTPVGQSGDAK
jgi:hypothetical protein